MQRRRATPRGARLVRVAVLVAVVGAPLEAQAPGDRSLLDAHNAYPYDGRWTDRLERALATGAPIAVEQDLVFALDESTGLPRIVVAHETELDHPAPTLVEHFFEAVRPLIEAELADPTRSRWPLVTLNLDVKGPAAGGATDSAADESTALRFLRDDVLGSRRDWLTTSPRTEDGRPAAFELGPLLVLTGSSDVQQKIFRDEIEVGDPILAFGAVHDAGLDDQGLPRPEQATDYRRWWNHPWRVIEREGQPRAGDFEPAERERLRLLSRRAHQAGLWLRLYTLNGIGTSGASERGWFAGYDFGSLEAVRERWRACIEAGVDFVATDQYEGLAALRASLLEPDPP